MKEETVTLIQSTIHPSAQVLGVVEAACLAVHEQFLSNVAEKKVCFDKNSSKVSQANLVNGPHGNGWLLCLDNS